MSEIPMYPDECSHRREPGRCWECLGAALLAEMTRAAAAEHKLGQIRVILENYSNDEHFSAWNAIGAIEELKP